LLALLIIGLVACLVPVPAFGAASAAPVAAPFVAFELDPGRLYELSMAPQCDYKARVRMWNPSTGEVWVDAIRMGDIMIHSMPVPGHLVCVAVGYGMQAFYTTPTTPVGEAPAGQLSAGMGPVPVAAPRMQALALLAEPLGCDLALLSENYAFSLAPGATVAGRETVEVRVAPKRPGNVRRTVWVDCAVGAALRIEDRDYRGSLIWLWEVDLISFAAHDPRMMEAARAALSSPAALPCAVQRMPLDEVSARAGFRVTLPAWAPEGYQLVAVRPARVPGAPGQRGKVSSVAGVVQLVYSDGLGAISLYERKAPWWARRASPPRLGQSIEWEHGGIRYVLVGDVDPELLLKMARSL